MSTLAFLQKMKHSPIHNYGGIPGLTSSLIGGHSDTGIIRLMECSRTHFEPIIPHSHRFDFRCQVLAGEVRNIIWTRGNATEDQYMETELTYLGKPGQYSHSRAVEPMRWVHNTSTYEAGEEYSMRAEQVHSIFFSRGAVVLFFEGPVVSDKSIILEPFVDGEVVPTFQVQPWAFKRGAA